MAKKILIVDDEKKIVEIVKAYLEKDGFTVVAAFDGKTAIDMTKKHNPDLVILDLMLPEISGWDVCRSLRASSDLPIIMLTARDEDTDKIVGLELGADDYITKPFNPKELVSRVKAVLRRSDRAAVHKKVMEFGDLSIDLDKHEVRHSGKPIDLTPTEFELLKVLIESPGRVYNRMQLLDRIQGDAYDGYERTIDSHIKNLRKKIGDDSEQPRYVITVRGVGYKFWEGADV